MTAETTDSPASLHGVVSLVLGAVALVTAVFVGYAGVAIPLLCGSLAVTFASLGLARRVNRGQCAIGLATGGLAVLCLVLFVAALGG
ncbi:hypothetical protein V1L54_06790 [Streptomyces sp. TRM 70361]|uniref:hypothetical protein n=1 Tax=Streptomyces sp. TRM 70361 TaxID=3116553 RepID=UPI002E7B7696|nr:hypothetical protein [Streptomyces sp. TRM 70361]MEE1939118.1 hypothetical protein [Streptomyces sp. TRM 70361]